MKVLNQKTLRHKNIVRLYTWVKTPDRFYLVMEACEAGDMLKHLNKAGRFSDTYISYGKGLADYVLRCSSASPRPRCGIYRCMSVWFKPP